MAVKRKTLTGHGRVLLLCSAGFLCVLLLVSVSWRRPADVAVHGNGLFSWHVSMSKEREYTALFNRMKELGLTELYQDIPQDTDAEVVRTFIAEAAKEGIIVYLLTGDPSWGLDASGTAMEEEVARAAGYEALRGVMMDVEPYLTEEWEEDPDGVMDLYIKAMAKSKTAADAAGLELVACIPYFYDDLGQAERLEFLAERGCHALAVMNYYKGEEAAHLETEAVLAGTYGRPLITIYELQAPGKHDLTEHNIYHNDGLNVLMDNWNAVKQAYIDLKISYALHDYTALEEVLGD